MFEKILNNLFDIVYADALILIKINKNKKFISRIKTKKDKDVRLE